MAAPNRWFRGAFASWALAVAGAVAAWAATPVDTRWTAHADEQFLLDVNIRQLRLGDGVRAYQTPEGTCVVFGDFLTTLDVPMKIDLGAKSASGWAFREENRIAIDLVAGKVRYGDKQEGIEAGQIRETPEGWCINTEALGRWFGLGVKPVTAGSLLLLESEAKLPVELAREREQRAARIRPAAMPLENLPKVKLPYRMWRAPALDFIVSAGVTYQATTGLKVDRRASVIAAGELARLSYDATLATDAQGKPQSLRFRAFRSEPDGGLLGPLNATHFAVGDVQGLASRLIGSGSGRGAEVTNRPLFNPATFDRTRFEGDLPPGWDAELYRNSELLAFNRSDGSGRYKFEDIPLIYGDNRFEIILHGPQGQQRSRFESVNVGQNQVPAGQTWYWAGISQPGKTLLGEVMGDHHDPPGDRIAGDFRQPDLQAAVQVEHGLSKRTSVGMMATMLLAGEGKLTFVEGSVRHSIGPALVEAGVARDTRGGMAGRVQAIARLGSTNISADAMIARDFVVNGKREDQFRDLRMSVDSPIKLGRRHIGAHADIRLTERGNADRTLAAAGRLSSNFNGFNLSTIVNWQRQLGDGPPKAPDRLDVGAIGTARIGDVRLRGETMWELSPTSRFRSAELSAYWSASDKADWEGAVGYDAIAGRGRARVSHIRRFTSLAAAASLEAGTDGSFAAGINLNFSLDGASGRVRMTNQRLASSGAVEARVYRDLNDNGRRDLEEPWEEGALITTGQRVSEEVTDKEGRVRVAGLQPYQPIAVGIDTTSLANPAFTPKKALQLVVPRPGIAARLEIGLVGAGDIEGLLVQHDGRGFEGLDIELVDASGAAVATQRTDYDGFFLFERVAYGSYTLRLTPDSARVTSMPTSLGQVAEIGPLRSVVRLGAIRLVQSSSIAMAGPESPGPASRR
ncbi:MSCRAMM family protein [Sphingomonas xanthus]|uniref:Carboxypeptidase regulatory-like domain-containing protein n=1 Tax=Sphingomonas xanthus TaxID=2594473 RepID=A0A516IRM4_9SPHN|nr:carboxypeptidase-like regulatory domain-containing protein [Sphingomonas xanthus]QDP19566.1 carboxypeptidase regulatory-like domain-containing protein [Sphingomonas xanthus]